MKLLYTPIAGYVHTVEAVINYACLRERIEPVRTTPFEADTPLRPTRLRREPLRLNTACDSPGGI